MNFTYSAFVGENLDNEPEYIGVIHRSGCVLDGDCAWAEIQVPLDDGYVVQEAEVFNVGITAGTLSDLRCLRRLCDDLVRIAEVMEFTPDLDEMLKRLELIGVEEVEDVRQYLREIEVSA